MKRHRLTETGCSASNKHSVCNYGPTVHKASYLLFGIFVMVSFLITDKDYPGQVGLALFFIYNILQ